MAPTGADSLLTTIPIRCKPMTEVVAAGKPRSRILRALYFGLGLICVGFAYLSWLPGIPTFDFVILAAFFFSRSSDRFHLWITSHPVFGRIIRGYRTDGLTVRAKIIASAAVVASLGFSVVVLLDNSVVRTLLGLVGLYALWFIWTRKTPAANPAIDVRPTGP
jgi:uncharacterized membrane protein YbaN (DUF454 family)